jgi:signal peptidase I
VPMAHSDAAAGSLAWVRLLVVLLARSYRAILLSLTVVAVAPLGLSWGAYVVESGSMRPTIAEGDVVVARDAAPDDRIRVGRVYVYGSPEDHRRLIVHRVVERLDDGTYTTAGDANDVTDLAPLERSAVRARSVLLVPYVGLPVHWLHTGQWVRLAAWLLLTVAAFVVAGRRLEHEPPRWWGRSRRRTDERPPAPTSRPRVPVAAAVALFALGGTLTAGSASAGYTARTGNISSSWTAGAWVQPYVGAVLADQPYGFWLLDEQPGTQYATDRSGNDRTGQYYGALALGRPGGLVHNPGTSVSTSGGRVVLGRNLVTSPAAYSVELWFRAGSGSTGFLAGFENDRDNNPVGSLADRIVQMDSAGRVVFGRWANRSSTITSPRTYDDGAWHHLVVTNTSGRYTVLYVDGVAVAAGNTSQDSTYAGYWRVGQGSTGSSFGNTSAFTGDIDNVSIFHTVLPSSRVAAHWAAR